MATVKSLVPEVRTHLSAAPEPQCVVYLRRAAQQFARKSEIWTVSIGTKDIVDADIDRDADYTELTVPETGADPDFTLPADSQIWAIDSVLLDDEPLTDFAYDLDTAKLSVASDELQSGTVEVRAVLEPTDDATNIPDSLARWKVGITSHAISEMMLMPNQEWSAPRLSEPFENKYLTEASRANLLRAKKRTRRPLRTVRRDFV